MNDGETNRQLGRIADALTVIGRAMNNRNAIEEEHYASEKAKKRDDSNASGAAPKAADRTKGPTGKDRGDIVHFGSGLDPDIDPLTDDEASDS